MAHLINLVNNISPFREQLKNELRPYDFANLLRACRLKRSLHERYNYLTMMNEIFYSETLNPILQKLGVKVIALGTDLAKMSVQLNIYSKIWNSTIYDQKLSLMILVIVHDIHDKQVLDLISNHIRRNTNMEKRFYFVSYNKRRIYQDYICITSTDFANMRDYIYTNSSSIYTIGGSNNNMIYDPFANEQQSDDVPIETYIEKYLHKRHSKQKKSSMYVAYYITNADIGTEYNISSSDAINIDFTTARYGSSDQVLLVFEFITMLLISYDIMTISIALS